MVAARPVWPATADWLSVSPSLDGPFGCLVDRGLPLAPPLRALLGGLAGASCSGRGSFRLQLPNGWSGAFLAAAAVPAARLRCLGVEA